MLALLLIEVHLRTAVAQETTAAEEAEAEEDPTCSLGLDPSAAGTDCSASDASASSDTDADASPADGRREGATSASAARGLTRRVVPLTDETFDELTRTPSPGTWLVMFKTDACALCKKATPVLESLALDAVIVNHNDGEIEAMAKDEEHGRTKTKRQPPDAEEEEGEGLKPMGPVYVYEEPKGGWDIPVPSGPVYIATVDAGRWSGRDTTRRFGVDATPTILVVRNDGYDVDDDESHDDDDPRSYYAYRGQRATYPLRGFVLGGFAMRKRMDMPPPPTGAERKPTGRWGRAFASLASPSAKFAGGIVGKVVLAWFAFMGLLGLFLRVHNYAWGEEDEEGIDGERTRGRREHEETRAKDGGSAGSQEERSARRQKAMWERKAENRARFAANREARRREKEERERGAADGGEEDDDEMKGVGFSVKKSDVKKGLNGVAKKEEIK